MTHTDQAKAKMQTALEHFKQDMKSIRTGRANSGMVDGVNIEVYGSQMRLKDIANVTAPEPRQLLISPFDPSVAPIIGKGLEKANLGFNVIVDGHNVRLKIPPMDENLRKEMVKTLHKKLEECKIVIRNIRREFNDAFRKQKADGEIPEDMLKKNEKIIQDFTDKFCKEADDLAAVKEKEVLTV